MADKNQINMTEGPILLKLMQFSVPLILTSILQLLFNAADIVVVGRFAGSDSMAAVGSTGSLVNLLVNLFMGLSIGTNVVAAHFYGANKENDLQEAVHTAVLLSIYSGIILTIVGVFSAKYLLTFMKTPGNVLRLATIYLKIYFGGITASMVYNFGSALLRAKGDTKRPLYILLVSGIVNFLLNLLFVICFKMDVAGVGLATVISQVLAASCIIYLLMKEENAFHLNLRNLHINGTIFARIVKIGVPAGFQGIMFSFSNVIIQSSVNSFGPAMIAANSAASNLEGFIYTSMNGFSQGTLTFCSQNMGAKKKDRIKKVVITSQIVIIVVAAVLSAIFLAFGNSLLGLYTTDAEIVKMGMGRLWVILSTYYLCGMMDSISNSIRGIGHSFLPVIVTFIGVCVFRIVWIFFMFMIPQFHVPFTIYVSYPISWIITWIVEVIIFAVIMKKLNFESEEY